MISINQMIRNNWPHHRPFPSEDEIEAARKRYSAELQAGLDAYDRGEGPLDSSDFPSGLEFVMATYSTPCWWHFFFPEEKMDFLTGVRL